MKVETTGKKDVSYAFAKHVANTQFKDIPAEVVEHTKEDILDTIAVTIAGSSYEGTEPLLKLLREWGGREESTILVFGDKVPCISAALANSSMADAHDFSDAYGRGLTHAGMSIVPPAFAIAERKGEVNGKDLITAIALGQDMALRMFLAIQLSEGLLPHGVNNSFGAAATVGKLLGLNEEQMVNAFGIAFSQVSGTLQIYLDCAMTKNLQAGIMAKTGILSALLAQNGFTGTRNTFEGKCGLCVAYSQGRCDLEKLTANLGKAFEGINVGFKPYPGGMCEHPMIDACLALVKEHNISPNDIEGVKVWVSNWAYTVFGEPTKVRMRPKAVCDAVFSGRYIAACAILDRKVDLSSFTDEAIKRPNVLQFMHRVDIEVDPDIGRGMAGYPPRVTPTRVAIRVEGGKVYEKQVDVAKGNPLNPMTKEELKDKFYHCASYSARPLPKENLDRVVSLIDRLEEVEDVSEVIALLVS